MRGLSFLRRSRHESAVTRARVDHRERVYAVGDIHGRADLLMALVDEIHEDIRSHDDDRSARLVFLGDYVDRGDGSRQVLEILRELSRGPIGCDCLMGNHEAALIDFLQDPSYGEAWIRMGGGQTLASFGVPAPVLGLTQADLVRIRDEFHEAVAPFLALLISMPSLSTSGDVVFCHAGVNPARPPEEQTNRALLWGHPDGLGDDPWPGKLVVHGHFDGPEVVSRPGRLCLDTGAYYSGVLAAARLDADERVMRVKS